MGSGEEGVIHYFLSSKKFAAEITVGKRQTPHTGHTLLLHVLNYVVCVCVKCFFALRHTFREMTTRGWRDKLHYFSN